MRLYRRLGFITVDETPMYLAMAWRGADRAAP
jgi:hypothetical protein